MCAVAGRGLFRGYDADDLAGLGIGFSLFDMPALAVLLDASSPRNRRSPAGDRRHHAVAEEADRRPAD